MNRLMSLTEYKDELQKEGLLSGCVHEENFSREIAFVTYDSRQVIPGTLFVCKGAAFKAEYLKSAINDGAVAYISEREYDEGMDVPAIIVSDPIRRAFLTCSI